MNIENVKGLISTLLFIVLAMDAGIGFIPLDIMRLMFVLYVAWEGYCERKRD